MNNSKNKSRTVIIIRWTSRIISIILVLFLILMFVGSFFDPKQSNTPSTHELISFVFFPVGLCVGLLLAWKRELLGGIIAIISMIAFSLTISGTIGMIIFAAPGVLFIICWYLSRAQTAPELAN